jgi:hypothetical protein
MAHTAAAARAATWGTWYWPAFLATFAVLLLVPEVWALITNAGNTLSGWVWRALHVTTPSPVWDWDAARLLSFGVWCVLVFWLSEHFWWGLAT